MYKKVEKGVLRDFDKMRNTERKNFKKKQVNL